MLFESTMLAANAHQFGVIDGNACTAGRVGGGGGGYRRLPLARWNAPCDFSPHLVGMLPQLCVYFTKKHTLVFFFKLFSRIFESEVI